MSKTVSVETLNGVVTSWFPASTAWPAVRQCSTLYYSHAQANTGGFSGTAFDPWYGQHWSTNLDCLPDAVTSWWQQTYLTPVQTVTSVGPLVCPELYTTASTSVLDSSSTFVGCCPSNYEHVTVYTSVPQLAQCYSSITSGQVLSYYIEMTPRPSTMNTTTIGTAGGFIYALPVNGYQIAQVSNPTTTTTGSGAAATATTATATTTPTSAASVTQATNTSLPTASAGLSSGATIGLGVGLSLGVVGLAALAAAFFLMRRNRRRAHVSGDGVGSGSDFGGAKLMQPPNNDTKKPIEEYAPIYREGQYELDNQESTTLNGAPVYKPPVSQQEVFEMSAISQEQPDLDRTVHVKR
ncbi:hypothetical protein G7Y89_g13179 [Cudoniella acicularis]|uniref:Uncharacterized protein n=1 Tax=Cudoniella acicularis TaxID=354080 RepID=A0A8H4VYH8_9HELO|nr:hypothetical protein G7Y89_g13179 [Cudoniella acicularis]